MKLRLADNLSLPTEAVTRTFGVLAVRGAGKSNTAAVMAEEMFSAGLPFVVVDPVGSWWGLRSSGDGTAPGLPIPIFGGKHGDIPLERGAGELVADLVVEKRLSCVLDLAGFDSEADKKAFLLTFARRLYQRNENPLHLFLEEADDYIPQKPMRDEAYLLRAWENIVRRGRARGLGMTLITQRSAALNKMVLTQVETLIAMRTTGPQDQKAIEAWIQYHQQSRDVMESLASLEDGEAWIWSPQFLKTMTRVQIRRRRTFDSGATPTNVKAKDARPPATLADVDLTALQQKMAATIEKAKADDPRELRQRIHALERELVAAKKVTPAPATVERVEVSVLKPEDIARLEAAIAKMDAAMQHLLAPIQEAAGTLDTAVRGLAAALLQASQQRACQLGRQPNSERPRIAVAARSAATRFSRSPGGPVAAETEVTPARQKILNALAFLEGIGVSVADKTQLALLVGVSPTSGGYFNNLGALRSAGLVAYPSGGTVALTEAGKRIASTDGVPQTTKELHAAMAAKLPPAKWRILERLIEVYPRALKKDALATQLGVSPTSGGYFNNLGSLRSLGLVEYPQPGYVVARPLLFLE